MRHGLPPRNLGVALAAVMTLGSASADGLLNGSFESPGVAPGTYAAVAPDGWAWAGPSGLVFNGAVLDPPSGLPWPSAQDGVQFVDIGNVPAYAIEQRFDIDTTAQYTLRWHDNTHRNASTSRYVAWVRNAADTAVLWSDVDAAHGGLWQQRSATFTLAAGSYTLAFRANGVPGGYDTLIDNVTLAVAVPEPQALLLFALGLPLLLLRRVRSA